MNNTRDFAKLMQSGVRDSRIWEWGPLWCSRVEFLPGHYWSVGITIGNRTLAIALSEAR